MKPRIRCSSLPRIFLCNGSLTLNAIVKPRDGDEGYEGTYIHWAVADTLIRNHGAIPPEGGLPPPAVPPGYKLPHNAEWMIDWIVRHVLEEIPADWSLLVEVEFEHEFDTWILVGHQDLLAMSPCGRFAKGRDWKTGNKGVEPAETNEQVNGYMVENKLAWDDLQSIEFAIVQPRADESSGCQRVSYTTLEGLALQVAAEVLDTRFQAAYNNRMELETGSTQCAYCVGCSCPALREDLNNMKLTLTPELLAQITAEPNDGLLADFVITARTLARPISDATEMLHERLDRCGQIVSDSGLTVTRKIQKGSYEIPDPKLFLNTVRTDLPNDDQLVEVIDFSMTRLKDTLAKVYNIKKTGKGDSAETRFEDKYRALVNQGERKLLVIS